MTESNERSAPWRSLVICIGSTLGAGALTGFLIRNDMNYYESLNKPAFTPPGWLFPVAWSILYLCMSIAAWLIYRHEKPGRKTTLVLYIIQLAVNLAWPWIFFVMHALGLAFIWLVWLWCLVIMLMVQAFRSNKAAGWLIVPYVLWISFAGVLNFIVAQLNP